MTNLPRHTMSIHPKLPGQIRRALEKQPRGKNVDVTISYELQDSNFLEQWQKENNC